MRDDDLDIALLEDDVHRDPRRGEPVQVGLQHRRDAAEILALQKLAYQSEAALYDDNHIPPLTQTLPEIQSTFASHRFLKAVSGDAIVGYISRGRGVTVHRADCHNVNNMEPERLKRDFESHKALIQARFDGEKNVLVGKIEALEKMAASQAALIADLSKKSELAYEKVQDIANRAVTSARRETYSAPTQQSNIPVRDES